MFTCKYTQVNIMSIFIKSAVFVLLSVESHICAEIEIKETLMCEWRERGPGGERAWKRLIHFDFTSTDNMLNMRWWWQRWDEHKTDYTECGATTFIESTEFNDRSKDNNNNDSNNKSSTEKYLLSLGWTASLCTFISRICLCFSLCDSRFTFLCAGFFNPSPIQWSFCAH